MNEDLLTKANTAQSVPSSDLLALQIRNLIAAREANTAQANQELYRGGWLWDHAQHDRELAAQIDALFEKAK
ncbi:MAG: hypothetical protein F9K25_16460 [Candidatus Contendobacter sp.]|nr:MAG: hypothetical protein F9K25_16460 [Candidatus Contendobacter sp.]